VQTGFWWGDLRRRDPLEGLGVGGEDNIKIGVQEVRWGSMNWIDLAEDRDRWRAAMNTVMNFRHP
jgi:hypothetical protein